MSLSTLDYLKEAVRNRRNKLLCHHHEAPPAQKQQPNSHHASRFPSSSSSLSSSFGARNRALLSSKFYISIAITCAIILTQVLLFHYFIGRYHGDDTATTTNHLARDWVCLYPGLGHIHNLAQRYDVDLVVIDPDLLKALEPAVESAPVGEEDPVPTLAFSGGSAGPFKRSHQESGGLKTIVHLAAINETSGGQPNLKLFYNALKNSGYPMLKYDDTSQLMQPEVYRRAAHLFDDMPLEAHDDHHKYTHDSASMLHSSFVAANGSSILDGSNQDVIVEDDEISKIYTEFIAHIFVLNNSVKSTTANNNDRLSPMTTSWCGGGRLKSSPGVGAAFTVIHVLVLYNYEYNPTGQWIQPGLQMDEMDKHKLLSYNVHSFDFKIPIDQYYIHPKRPTIRVIDHIGSGGRRRHRKEPPIEKSLRILQHDPLLRYSNNSYVHCKPYQFSISGLIGSDPKRMSNYLRALDSAKPIIQTYEAARRGGRQIQEQLITALQFMDTYSKAYGNFSYWLTGSTLLAYYRHCQLDLVPDPELLKSLLLLEGGGAGEEDANDQANASLSPDDFVVNLELGVFAAEVNDSVMDDLARAHTIGVAMLSDWRKSNRSFVNFQIRDCPNVIFNIYLYELKRDFYQYYFVTRNTMTMNHKFNRRSRGEGNNNKNKQKSQSGGSHIFNTNNLDLCLTRIEKFHPFRVPCNVYDHLRRIYII